MKTRILTLALAAGIGAGAAISAQAETYVLDPRHTQVLFTYSHFGFSNITGRFDDIEGEIVYDPQDIASASISITVPIATVSTGVAAMDEHLRKDDLFDAAQFPTATFQSTSVSPAGEGKYKVTGDLTIHGVTKETEFDVTLNRAAPHPMRNVPTVGFDAVGHIKRSDFGVDKYVPNIPDEVVIRVTTEALAESDD